MASRGSVSFHWQKRHGCGRPALLHRASISCDECGVIILRDSYFKHWHRFHAQRSM